MLLSEILNIAKDIQQKRHKPINESLNGKFLINLLDKTFKDTNVGLKAVPINDENSVKNTLVKLNDRYKYLARYDNLTQEECDDPKFREKILNCKYLKVNYISNILKLITQRVKNLTKHNIALSELEDTDFVKITKDESRKKPYKNCLQFHLDVYDKLKAVCLDNKILVYFNNDNYVFKADELYKVNYDYTGPTDITDDFENYHCPNRVKFILNAFTRIPNIDILTDPNLIKKCIGAANVKTLLENGHIFTIYALKPDVIDTDDLNEKMQTRKEYKEYLESQMNLNRKNIERYKNIILLNKKNFINKKVTNKTNEILDTLMDLCVVLKAKEIQLISDSNTLFKPNNYYYMSSVELYKLYNQLSVYIQEHYSDLLIDKSPTKRYKEYIIKTTNIGDIFRLLNIEIELILTETNKVINLLNLYGKVKNDNLSDEDNIMYLKKINVQYKQLRDLFTKKIFQLSLDALKDSYNIDINYIFYNFYLLQEKIIKGEF